MGSWTSVLLFPQETEDRTLSGTVHFLVFCSSCNIPILIPHLFVMCQSWEKMLNPDEFNKSHLVEVEMTCLPCPQPLKLIRKGFVLRIFAIHSLAIMTLTWLNNLIYYFSQCSLNFTELQVMATGQAITKMHGHCYRIVLQGYIYRSF